MPAEEIYRPQVMPRAGAAMPGGSVNATIGALGGNIAALGDTFHRDAVRQYTIERQQTADREQADFTRRFAQLRVDMDARSRDSRSSAGPGGQGHMQSMAEAMDEARGTLFEGITEQRILDQAQAQFDDYAGRFHSNEANWEEGQRIAKTVNDFQQFTDISANRARSNHEPDVYADELRTGFEAIDAMSVPPDVKDQLKQRHEQTVASAFLQGVIDTNPQVAMGMIAAGMFNERLTPQQIDGAMNGANVEIRRAEARAEQERAAQAAAVREQIQTLKEADSQGIDVSDQLPAARAAAEALGDSSLALELDGLAANSRFARIYGQQTPVQRDARIAALSAKARPTADEQRELHWLQSRGSAMNGQFNSDPTGWAISNAPTNLQPPALDMRDPASIARRQQWARTASRTYGRPMPMFTANEAAQLRAQAEGSPQGMIEVAGQIAAFGGRDAINAAGLIAPQDGMLARLVVIPANNRAASARGAEVRRANTTLVDGANTQHARQAFDAAVGRSLGAFPNEQREAVFQLALNLYADRLQQTGNRTFDAQNFATWIPTALGSRLGTWQGRRVALPTGMNQTQFDAALTGYEPTQSENAPVLRNGTAMTAAQLRSYTPVLRPDGLYEFRDQAGGQVRAKSGRTFTIDMTPRRH